MDKKDNREISNVLKEAHPSKDGVKKQIPLRLSARMYQEIAAWAEDDFRSVNGQIEYLLNECLKRRKGLT